jgi:uncharacterized phage-like protein YoqJ
VKRVLIMGYKASELGIFSLKHPGIAIIKKAIKKQLISLVDEGLEWVIVSGQWGVELWAAEAAIELQDLYPALQIALVTPFLEQDEKWSEDKKNYYRSILKQVNYVNSVTKSKYEGGWQFREKNKFLMHNSDGLILVYDEELEGSPKYIKALALQHTLVQAYPILSITANDLQNIADEEQMEYEAREVNEAGDYI